MSKRQLLLTFDQSRNYKKKPLTDDIKDGTRKSELDEEQTAKEAVEYIINTIERDAKDHRDKLSSPKFETSSTFKITYKPIHLAGSNQKDISYDGDDEKDVDNNSDVEDSFDVFAQKPPFVSGRMSSNNDTSTSNNATNDNDQVTGGTATNIYMSNTDGRNNQLQREENTAESHVKGIILPSTLFSQSESDEYHSSDSDYFPEITIRYITVIDDRKPDQDHVKERVFYCDSCIKRDDDTSERDIYVKRLCFDREKYLCLTCSRNCTDAGHLIAHMEDSESVSDDFCRKIVEQLSSKDNTIARMNHEQFVCTGKVDITDQGEEPNELNITGMCYTENGSIFAMIDENLLKLFNGFNYKLKRVIDFSDKAYGITEVTFFDGKEVSYFAITFPYESQILLVDIDRPDPIVTYLHLRQMKPRDIYYREDATLMVLCYHLDDEPFSIEKVILTDCLLRIATLDIRSLLGSVTSDVHDYYHSELKLVVHRESRAYFISSEKSGYIKHMADASFRHEDCKAFVSNPAVHSVICVDKSKNVYASIGDESHEYGIYKSDEDLKIWKLCIPASDYIAGKSTLGMVHKDRLFLLTKSEDGRQYITIFQNEVSDRGYGEGSPL